MKNIQNEKEESKYNDQDSIDQLDSEELDGDLNISESNDIELIEKWENIKL